MSVVGKVVKLEVNNKLLNIMLRKSLVLAGLLLATTQVASAQATSTLDSVVTTEFHGGKHAVVTNKFGSNWFVGVGVGAQMLFADHSTRQMKFFDQLTPNFDLYVGKWFTPGLAIRLGVSGIQVNGVSGPSVGGHQGYIKQPRVKYDNGKGDLLFETEMKYLNAHLDIMLNLSQMIGGYNEDRFYSFIPYAGLGWMQSLEKASVPAPGISNNDGYTHEVSASIGLLNRFRVSRALDINLDVRGAFVNDRFDQQIGARWGEGVLSASVGVSYNFPKRGWDRATTTTIRVGEGTVASLRDRIAELQDANEDLRRQLHNALNREVTSDNVSAQPLLVTFTINRWTLTKKDRVNLGYLAAAIKANPKMVYTVVGYADQGTGSSKRNIFLSRKRAEVVYNCLVQEFGVSEAQLKKDFKGGVANMYYNDPRLSRAVLTKIAE